MYYPTIKKVKKGHPYYYAVQSSRVDGKPRIVWQKYLGTIEAIVQRTDQAKPPKPKESVIFEAGGVAVLLRITQKLGLLELISEIVPKREQGPSPGHYLVLAAINRALAPCSKVCIADWYEQTVLRQLWHFPKTVFSSQRFWDHIDMVSETAITTIQKKLAALIKQHFGLDGRVLLYDTTNFFTFLATTNDRCTVAKRGHSKAKRHDLRQVGLALLVTREFQVPLFHRVYDGNIPDITLFPKIAKELTHHYDEVFGASAEATLVFDKGNVCDNTMELLIASKKHFVAALPANRIADLLAVPIDQFQNVPGLPGTQAFIADTTFWDTPCRAVVVYTESFFTQQLCGVTNNLVKCQKKLMDLEKKLSTWRKGNARGKRPTSRSVQAHVRTILAPQFMNDLFHISIEQQRGIPILHYKVDHTALDTLVNERLGRTVLVTDHPNWTPHEIISAYRNLASIEEAFKNMKHIKYLRWQPAYHWTNQKLKVHGFYCVLALLLATLAHKVTVQSGIDLTIINLLKELNAIREVAVIYPHGTLAHRKDHITLTRMSALQKKLAEIFEIEQLIDG